MKEKEIKLTPLYFDHVFGAKYDAIVEIGGRYSAKSYNSQIEEACNLASKENYKLLIIQDLDKGGSDGYYAGLVDKIEQFEHTPAYNISPSSTKIVNKYNGNTVLFRGYKTDQQKKDVKNIDQVTKIVVEEGEWVDFDDFLALIQQLRGKVEEDRRLDILLNPVNEYCFANEHLVQGKPDKVIEYFPNSKRPKVFEKKFKIEELSINVLVVLSTHFDNPYLTDIQRASIEIYRTSDPEKYKQLGEARFIKSGGSFFKEFDKDIHVIEPFKIPDHWDRYSASDYGLDMEATLWFAIDERGKAYAYKESHKPDLIISEAAEEIKRMTGGDKLRIKYAPPDLWNRRQETGKSAWEIFTENGVVFVKSDNNVDNGCMATKEWLNVYNERDTHTGHKIQTSDLVIFDNCTNLIRCLSQIKTDEKKPNRYAKDPHELTHIVDALRYFCIMRTSPSAKKKKALPQDALPQALRTPVERKSNGLTGQVQEGFGW